jgi:hypothetical protein
MFKVVEGLEFVTKYWQFTTPERRNFSSVNSENIRFIDDKKPRLLVTFQVHKHKESMIAVVNPNTILGKRRDDW